MSRWFPGMTLAEVERETIQQAFRFYGQNKTHTAEALGIAVRTLDAKLEQYKQEHEAKQAAKNVAPLKNEGKLTDEATHAATPIQPLEAVAPAKKSVNGNHTRTR